MNDYEFEDAWTQGYNEGYSSNSMGCVTLFLMGLVLFLIFVLIMVF